MKIKNVYRAKYFEGDQTITFEMENGNKWNVTLLDNKDFVTLNGEFDVMYDEETSLEKTIVIEAAEKLKRELEKEIYVFHDAGFNCAIVDIHIYIRENKEDETATVILVDSSKDSYCRKYGYEEDFGSLEQAKEFCNLFRTPKKSKYKILSAKESCNPFSTDDYQDIAGAYALMENLK